MFIAVLHFSQLVGWCAVNNESFTECLKAMAYVTLAQRAIYEGVFELAIVRLF
jgi:hypothetical protein